MTQKLADWDRAKQDYPSWKYGVDEWVAFFDQRPDVMHQILGDIFVITKADEAKQRGEGRDGRRSKHINGSLDELYAMITPRYATEPFSTSILDLIGKMSLRQFAMKAGMDHRELSRLIRGKQDLTMYVMEKIALAGGVHAAFFMEWRNQFVLHAISSALTSRPNTSIRAVKILRQGVPTSVPARAVRR